MCVRLKKSASGHFFFKRNHFIMGDLKIFGGWRLKKLIYAFGRCFFLKQFGVCSKTSAPLATPAEEKYILFKIILVNQILSWSWMMEKD